MIQRIVRKIATAAGLLGLTGLTTAAPTNDALLAEVSHHYAENDGVNIHYVKTGKGPLVVMVHGFPDYWYSWREQIKALKDRFTVVAMDQRG